MIIILSLAVIFSGFFELFLRLKSIWPKRKIYGWIIFLIVLMLNGWLLIGYGNRLWVISISIVSLYRLFNVYRITESRIQSEYLRSIVKSTSIRLMVFQLVVMISGILFSIILKNNQDQWDILGATNFLLSFGLFITIRRQLKISQRIALSTILIDKKAPTLTVAIPARNESDSLNNCLISLLSCDYPKLEIMVLDDQSTTQRTSEVIRSFAHQGVVFIAGAPVKKGWLAKNWAYEQLLEAANGDIILFCGADTRFTKESLKFLVSSLVSRHKSVISILPKNDVPQRMYSRFFQPLRYAWEVALPRRKLQRPPVLSTCWLAKRSYLVSKGGFKAVTNRVVPESYFAKLSTEEDGYSFSAYDGVLSNKPLADLVETALRLRYPQLRRRPELVALITMIELWFMLSILALVIYGIIIFQPFLFILSLISIIIYSYVFGTIAKITYRQKVLFSYVFWPFYLVLDIYLMHLSMFKYEFGEVLWKGRSVVSTVMDN
jgi:glycosyltransferase involved in cell wall biosynthesis